MANSNREVKSGVTWNGREVKQPEEDAVGDATEATQSPISTDIQKYMQTVAAESVLEMGYPSEMVQRAIERVLIKGGIEKLTGEIIMDAIFSIEEEETNSPHTSRGEENTTREIDGHETEGGASASEPSDDQESAQERIMREYQELRNASLCKICFRNTICVVFLPCGHLVTCVTCAPQIKKCPVCRALVRAIANAYFK